MKARNVLIGIVIFFILFNFIPHFSGNVSIPEDTTVNKIAYLIGFNFLIVVALIFLIIAFFIHRKVNRKRRQEMLDSFLK